MLIYLFSFNKRGNDFTSPALDTGSPFEAYLKSDSSLTEPYLDFQTVHNPTGYNYMYVPDYNRYYFLENWTYDRGLWSCRGTVDVLASWEGYIKSMSAFVVLSASDYNEYILDNRIAATAEFDRQVSSAPFAGSLAGEQLTPGGSFALTVINNESALGTGVATTYFLDWSQMIKFGMELLADDPWSQLKEFFLNPLDGIIDCYYLPINVGQYVNLTGAQAISVGNQTFEATGCIAQNTNLAVKSHSATVTIPWGYRDFRRMSPYSEITLFVPYCGSKTLPTELLSDVEAVLIDYSVDVSSGAVQAISYVKQEVIAEFSGNLRVSLPVGQTQSRVDSLISGAAGAGSAAIGVATSNPAAVLGGLAAVAGSVVSPQQYNLCGGMNGSVLGAILGNEVGRWQYFRLACTSRGVSDEPENIAYVQGRPLYAARTISSLSGYCQTSNFSIQAPCTDTERQRIQSLMDGGVYL